MHRGNRVLPNLFQAQVAPIRCEFCYALLIWGEGEQLRICMGSIFVILLTSFKHEIFAYINADNMVKTR